MLTGNQLHEKLRAWLSPPNPIINHNVACEAHQPGTSAWFIMSSTFQEWKINGSLLWIQGNRMSLPPLLPICLCSLISFPDSAAGTGKTVLWYVVSRLIIETGNSYC
jgi:hypothetical protein